MKINEIDEALISFTYELFKNKVDIKPLIASLDNHGITKTDIIYSEEITSEEKIELLQAIDQIPI